MHNAHLYHGPIKYNYLASRLARYLSTTGPCMMVQLRLIIHHLVARPPIESLWMADVNQIHHSCVVLYY